MVKKVSDSGNAQPEKASSEIETKNATVLQQKTIPNHPPTSFFLSKSFAIQCLAVFGIFGALAASYGVQYYQDTYVIPPKKEKSFPFWQHDNYGNERPSLRRVPDKNSVLKFTNLKNRTSGDILLELISDGMPTPFEKLDWYEYDCPDNTRGDIFSFSFGRMNFIVTHVFNEDGFDLRLEGNNLPQNTQNVLFSIVLSQDSGMAVSIPLVEKHESYHRVPAKLELDSTEKDEVKSNIVRFEKEWQEAYESMFELTKQQMPEPYKVLGRKGLAYAFSCVNLKPNVQLVGVYNTNFTLHREFYYIESRNIPLRSLEEQVFPMIAMSKFDSTDVLRVLNSWINTVNDLGYMGVWISENGVHLEKVQTPLLFQLVKQFFGNKHFDDKFGDLRENLEVIAEYTWKNSIGPGGLKDVKWLGHSRGLFQLEPATAEGSSSFELLCLLEDMCRVMQEVLDRSGLRDNTKWSLRAKEVETARSFYWDKESKRYNDLEQGKLKNGRSSHVPLIISLLKPDSAELGPVFSNLLSDSSLTPLGIQISEEQGVPVSTNYLFLRSLKFYSESSGPSQENSHRLYSQVKNNLIAAIARSNRIEKSFYGSFDRDMRPLGWKGHLDGTLVLAIMTE